MLISNLARCPDSAIDNQRNAGIEPALKHQANIPKLTAQRTNEAMKPIRSETIHSFHRQNGSRSSRTSMGIRIVMTDSEPVEAALRRLKKQLDREGVLWELRRRSFFVNGTERRRAKAFRKRFKTRMAALIAQRNAGMSQSAIAQANAAFWQRTGKP